MKSQEKLVHHLIFVALIFSGLSVAFLLHEQIHSQCNGSIWRLDSDFPIFGLSPFLDSVPGGLLEAQVRLCPEIYTLNSGTFLVCTTIARFCFSWHCPRAPFSSTIQDNVFLSLTGVGLEIIWIPVRSTVILAEAWEEPAEPFFGGETWQLGRTWC